MAFNMRPTKNPMPTQAPEIRKHNFDEVAIGVHCYCNAGEQVVNCFGVERSAFNILFVDVHGRDFIPGINDSSHRCDCRRRAQVDFCSVRHY